jgi:hypothetical protein
LRFAIHDAINTLVITASRWARRDGANCRFFAA